MYEPHHLAADPSSVPHVPVPFFARNPFFNVDPVSNPNAKLNSSDSLDVLVAKLSGECRATPHYRAKATPSLAQESR